MLHGMRRSCHALGTQCPDYKPESECNIVHMPSGPDRYLSTDLLFSECANANALMQAWLSRNELHFLQWPAIPINQTLERCSILAQRCNAALFCWTARHVLTFCRCSHQLNRSAGVVIEKLWQQHSPERLCNNDKYLTLPVVHSCS